MKDRATEAGRALAEKKDTAVRDAAREYLGEDLPVHELWVRLSRTPGPEGAEIFHLDGYDLISFGPIRSDVADDQLTFTQSVTRLF